MEMMMLEESAEEEENEAMEGSWTYADGRIVLKMDDESVMELDAEEGDLVGKAAEEEYAYLFGRELVKEDVDLDALMAAPRMRKTRSLLIRKRQIRSAIMRRQTILWMSLVPICMRITTARIL